jgi:hypothetical protein
MKKIKSKTIILKKKSLKKISTSSIEKKTIKTIMKKQKRKKIKQKKKKRIFFLKKGKTNGKTKHVGKAKAKFSTNLILRK